MAISSLHLLSCNQSFFLSSQFSKPLFINLSQKKPRFSISFCLKQSESGSKEHDDEEEEEFTVVTAVRSRYNEIVIVDTFASRYLLLDSTRNVHSVINKGGQNWTGAYWVKCGFLSYQHFCLQDESASLPPIIPNGPIAIYGLGGGTAARLILELWPSTKLEGWEIDEILIEKARNYLGLSELEIPTSKGGRLCIHVDDALSPSQDDSKRYAGIIVDLFADGKVLDQLQHIPMWLELASRLMPNGRLMVNCAGIETEVQNGKPQLVLDDLAWMLNSTVKIFSEAFPRQVSWKRTPDSQGLNFVALTGGLPDRSDWSNKVPVRLSESVKLWKLCETPLNISALNASKHQRVLPKDLIKKLSCE
ncbi:hypothetical protein ARALYDRAFT_330935 [Arabidopsis lyrata subsp. lyrata]|uniref:S-adenosyl-L-methionine-dependent methyltransferases superfamily protein n=2 Tax=Arabidopsis lyrata subsp. lyrata TaxID=81972 RepID=D7MLK2_ARALL|nr:hypothetical protein ARALYDRAFT_330935 [Arabidopsis lyrata subsp. lyrata]